MDCAKDKALEIVNHFSNPQTKKIPLTAIHVCKITLPTESGHVILPDKGSLSQFVS
jgi:hypothetical protein